MNIEEHLRVALAREQAPKGFASRVIQKAAERRRRRTALAWMAIAALFAAASLITVEVRDYEARREEAGRKAGQQVALALKIASAKLHATRKLLRRTTHAI